MQYGFRTKTSSENLHDKKIFLSSLELPDTKKVNIKMDLEILDILKVMRFFVIL